ncbi:MAG: UDP-N-acetylmuramoyl-tripeptide--D-alanyl-D-alanine ligase [Gammaproteobacteria bacterium]|nr:UDP-N-acetylmuramoyl-tripeptide--D-alanyl-D-alanine ligase [Gammaproteobacteria bacterium]
MISAALSKIAGVLDGQLIGEDGEFIGVCLDSRRLVGRNLFVALRAERDGHDFASSACQRGAAALLVERPLALDIPQIVVADTSLALTELASWWRDQLRQTRFFAVTGSNGKTTVKNMLAGVLSKQGTTQWTQGNLNNHLGVPLTLFSISPSCRFAVIEMGASGPNEIAKLCSLVRPHVSIGLNAGNAHLEGFGTEENLRRAKGEIFARAPMQSKCVYWVEQPMVEDWLQQIGARQKAGFGLSSSANVRLDGEWIVTDGEQCELQLQLAGQHNRLNAAAVIAATVPEYCDLATACAALSQVMPEPGRLEVLLDGQIRVINDAYNANPASMLAALEVLSQQSGRLKVFVMGDMAELGETALDQHFQVLDSATPQCDAVFYVGQYAAQVSARYGQRVSIVSAISEINTWLGQQAQPVSVLFKASRSAGLDAWAKACTEKLTAQEAVK